MVGEYTSLAFMMPAAAVIGYFLGYLLDKEFGTAWMAIAGLIVTARLDAADPKAGLGYELDSIAAVVIGGTSLSGGQGGIIGTILGALIMGVLRNGLNLMEVPAAWQQAFIGSVIIVAVLADQLRKRGR